jgi:Na+/H+-dicarboxylate symporter
VDVLPDMFATVLNITGDLAAVAIVVRTEAGAGGAGGPVTLPPAQDLR